MDIHSQGGLFCAAHVVPGRPAGEGVSQVKVLFCVLCARGASARIAVGLLKVPFCVQRTLKSKGKVAFCVQRALRGYNGLSLKVPLAIDRGHFRT